ncbi:unnamed protein product [Fraxinus pennsylvanica]|uniref:Uncharacterized protein n=1 Tax=Fraxinus pennsylvanica TaxID=56036 RepID=A0AAD1YJZ2_9LAMI|nr:unnamed protein product [Fraxinus pennsylvanica]
MLFRTLIKLSSTSESIESSRLDIFEEGLPIESLHCVVLGERERKELTKLRVLNWVILKIKVWDTQEKKCIRALMGNTGSVKLLVPILLLRLRPASGSRDGSFDLWDTRCSDITSHKLCVSPITTIINNTCEAHLSRGRRWLRRGKAESMSITSVLYLEDEVSIAMAGAVDSVIKFWDTRHLKGPVTQACPYYESSAKSSCYSNTISPPSIRKRVMALPRMEHRKLFADETLSTKSDTKNWTSNDVSHVNLPRSSRLHEIGTLESQKKRISFNSEVNKNLEKTPEAEMKSPSSVLNPPSLKRGNSRLLSSFLIELLIVLFIYSYCIV